jgi:hypothetical protein
MSSKHTKIKERQTLAINIELLGIAMPSCSTCDRSGRTCIVADEKSSRCAECVRQGKACDVRGPSLSDWASIDRQEEKLEKEEEEAMMKVLRLRKQKRLLRARRKEMLRRGLRTLDELDAAEEAEKVAAAAIPLPTGDFEFPEIPLDPVEAAAFWASLDTGGERLQASQGSS